MSPEFDSLVAQAGDLIAASRRAGATIATAESCTGGLISAILTEVPGSSDVFQCGFVTYANDAKTRHLGVSKNLIAAQGAVSREVAGAMAEGLLAVSGCTLAVAVTGIAGPGGGSLEKPVGLVHLAAVSRAKDMVFKEARYGDRGRRAIRLATVRDALDLLNGLL